jgi:hypothetical protein
LKPSEFGFHSSSTGGSGKKYSQNYISVPQDTAPVKQWVGPLDEFDAIFLRFQWS